MSEGYNLINNVNSRVKNLEKKVKYLRINSNKSGERGSVGPTGPLGSTGPSGFGKICDQKLTFVASHQNLQNSPTFPFNLTVNYITIYGVSTEILSNVQSLPFSITLNDALLGTPIGIFLDPDTNVIGPAEPNLFNRNGNYVTCAPLTFTVTVNS